ncbi:MAG: hypothetical protein QOG06_2728 [Gaiellaceae bacterium]|nr:hypothetical protein [Gaiellaceae bacterium]
MRQLPDGTVTFLFTDVEGSTKLLHELGAERYAEALGEHRRILRDAFSAHRGVEVDTQGDAFFVAFPTASGALEAAAEGLVQLEHGPIRVRIGIHTGTPHLGEEGYVGVDVHRAARIAAVGHGGQLLISASTAALLNTDGLHDLGEHRLKDLSAPERIYQLGDEAFPPLKSLHQTNLPSQPTLLVGRDTELLELIQLLREHRLVTITGPGGTGKTRLALQAAAELADEFRDGIWFISLAALRDPELVESTIAQTLGLSEAQALSEHVGSKQILLLLDNLEQLLEAASGLGELVRMAPRLKLLATSRSPLRLAGEYEYPLDPLRTAEGIELFLERARAAKPRFESDEHVAEICRRLDNLPLALELAAARVKVLSPTQMLERLGRSLDLLTRGSRDAPERQRTLRATIEWSYQLLSEEEKQLFAELSVFAGSFELEAAEAVCEAELDALGSLVDESLLSHTERGRFFMLETIREFARERLSEGGARKQVELRHAAWYTQRIREIAPVLRGPRTAELLAWYEAEANNLWVALEELLDAGESKDALRLANSLAQFWVARGSVRQGIAWLTDALAVATELSPERADALVRLGDLYDRTGQLDEGLFAHREARSLAERLALPETLVDALRGLAWNSFLRGEPAAAVALGREEFELALGLDDPNLNATAASDLSVFLAGIGELDEAETYAERDLAFRRSMGDEVNTAIALLNVNNIVFRRGDFTRASSQSKAALALLMRLGIEYEAATASVAVASAELAVGSVGESLRYARKALDLGRDSGNDPACLWAIEAVALTTSHTDPTTAARLLGAVHQTRRQRHIAREEYEIPGAESRLAALRAKVGDAHFDEAMAAGAELALGDAIALALDLAECGQSVLTEDGSPP